MVPFEVTISASRASPPRCRSAGPGRRSRSAPRTRPRRARRLTLDGAAGRRVGQRHRRARSPRWRRWGPRRPRGGGVGRLVAVVVAQEQHGGHDDRHHQHDDAAAGRPGAGAVRARCLGLAGRLDPGPVALLVPLALLLGGHGGRRYRLRPVPCCHPPPARWPGPGGAARRAQRERRGGSRHARRVRGRLARWPRTDAPDDAADATPRDPDGLDGAAEPSDRGCLRPAGRPAAPGHPPGPGPLALRRRGALRWPVERLGRRRLRAWLPQPEPPPAQGPGRLLPGAGERAHGRDRTGRASPATAGSWCSASTPSADIDAAEPVQRFVQSIIEARGDFNGRVLSLRHDDLKALCVLCGGDIPTGVAQLRAWGVLLDGPEVAQPPPDFRARPGRADRPA